MPLAACGWVGVFLQGLALALGGGTPVHKRSSSKYLRKLESLSVDTRSTGTVLDAPEDVWQRIERHLVSRDLPSPRQHRKSAAVVQRLHHHAAKMEETIKTAGRRRAVHAAGRRHCVTSSGSASNEDIKTAARSTGSSRAAAR